VHAVRYIVLGLVALIAASAFLTASATNTSFTSEGCYGSGSSSSAGTNQIRSNTNAWKNFTAIICNYTYASGYYRVAGSSYWVGPIGKFWGALYEQVTYVVENTDRATGVAHTACWAGGPCSGVVYGYTQYP